MQGVNIVPWEDASAEMKGHLAPVQVFREAKRKNSLLQFSFARGKEKRNKDYFFREMLAKNTSLRDVERRRLGCDAQSSAGGGLAKDTMNGGGVTTQKHGNSHAEWFRVEALS